MVDPAVPERVFRRRRSEGVYVRVVHGGMVGVGGMSVDWFDENASPDEKANLAVIQEAAAGEHDEAHGYDSVRLLDQPPPNGTRGRPRRRT